MTRKKLEYNFHDAIVVSCQMEKDDSFSITLQLYEIFYPTKDIVKLLFSKVFNLKKTVLFFTALAADEVAPDWNGSRVNAINYDTTTISTELHQYIFINIDGIKPISIHCKKIRIEKC